MEITSLEKILIAVNFILYLFTIFIGISYIGHPIVLFFVATAVIKAFEKKKIPTRRLFITTILLVCLLLMKFAAKANEVQILDLSA